MKHQYLRRPQALKILPVNPSYLAELARAGKVEAIREEGHAWLYEKASLEAYARKYRFGQGREGRPWSGKEIKSLQGGKTVSGRTRNAARVKRCRIKKEKE